MVLFSVFLRALRDSVLKQLLLQLRGTYPPKTGGTNQREPLPMQLEVKRNE